MDHRVYKIKLQQEKGQSILETALSFFVIFLFLGGIVNIWLWVNKQIVERQMYYNASRQYAGFAIDDYQLNDAHNKHPWPVYLPPNITEDKVLLENKPVAQEGEKENVRLLPQK